MNERLKQLRKALNISQADFANTIGLKASSVSLLESGQRNFTEQTIKSICREFHVNKQWLTTGEGDMFLAPSDEDLNEQIEHIMAGENEFHKNMFRMLANFDDEDLIALERLVKKLAQAKGNSTNGQEPPTQFSVSGVRLLVYAITCALRCTSSGRRWLPSLQLPRPESLRRTLPPDPSSAQRCRGSQPADLP